MYIHMTTETNFKGMYHALHILYCVFLQVRMFSYIGLFIIQNTKCIKSDTLHHAK